MASALFDIDNGLQLENNRGFFSANGNAVVNAVTTSSGLYWTGNGKSISGITITASATPPTSPPPSIGDQWYNTSNDVVYQYQSDGTNTYWVDISSAVVAANANTAAINTTITDSIKANVGAYQLYANANIGTLFLGNSITNANLGAYQTWANSRIDTLNANVGAYQIWANANASAQQTSINSINANVGAYQIWANANVSSLQSQINALAPASISEFQTYANSKIGTNSNSSILTPELIVSNPNYGVAATISVTPFQPVGTQTWTFRGATGLGNPNTSWINFPDGTNQYTAYPGTATSLSVLDANLGTATTNISNLVTQANANTAAYLTTYTGNVSAGNVSISGQAYITHTPPVAQGVALNITAKDNKGGAGYADFLAVTNTSSGASNINKWFRVNITGELQIINSAYTAQLMVLSDAGDLTIAGNVVQSGIKPFYSANRPAFRVHGSTVTAWNTATNGATNYFNSNQYGVDYNTGSYLNTTSGVFTAPVAGLYQVNLNARNAGNTSVISQACIVQNATGGNGSGGTIVLMLEFDASSTMNHAGVGTTLQLAVSDTLVLKVLAGTIQFDSNDSWSVAYIG